MGFFDRYPYTNWHNVNLDWVLERVKEWGEMVEANDQAFKDLEEANASFKVYVENYLQDLNIQEQIDDKLDRMLEDGTLTPYLQPYVSTAVTEWLEEHITEPVGVVIDSSLTVAGAAADAKAVGDKINEIDNDNIKQALLACFNNVAWKSDNAPFFMEWLRTALYRLPMTRTLFTNGIGLTVSNNIPIVSTNANRGLIYQEIGAIPLLSSIQGGSNVYPIHIPENAIGVKFYGIETTDYVSLNLQIILYQDGNWKIISSAGFAKVVPDTLSRTEITNYNDGRFYMIGTYGVSDATHTNPLDRPVTIDTSDFSMEVIVE